MTVRADLDAQIAAVERAGLTPVNIVLSYEDHWRLSYHDLGGPDGGHYTRPGAYATLAPAYRGLPIVSPGLAYDEAPVIGVHP